MTMILITVFIALIIVITILILLLIAIKTKYSNLLKSIRSNEVRRGITTEQWIPFLSQYPWATLKTTTTSPITTGASNANNGKDAMAAGRRQEQQRASSAALTAAQPAQLGQTSEDIAPIPEEAVATSATSCSQSSAASAVCRGTEAANFKATCFASVS